MIPFQSNEIHNVPIDRIDLPEAPLRLFEPATQEEVKRLVESIGKKGLLYPIIVKRDEESGRFKIIGGETRFRACVLTGYTEVPCRAIHSTGDPGEEYLIALMDNLARKEMHPLDIADAFEKLLEYFDRQEIIYRALGWTKGRFSQVFSLRHLPEEVRQTMKDYRRIDCEGWNPGERHLRAINRMSSFPDLREKQMEVTRQMLENRWDVSKTESAVGKILEPEIKRNQKKRRGRKKQYVEVPGMPENTKATVSPGKLALEIYFEEDGDFKAKIGAVAEVITSEDFDPIGALREHLGEKASEKRGRAKSPMSSLSENPADEKP